jgi:hypothetical protein
MSHHYEAIDLNPLHWLGDAASSAVGDIWKSAMTGLWSAALWCIKTAFQLIDSFTNPDLSSTGPMREVLPTTLWIGGTLAGIMLFVQLTLALVRRDGESMGRIFIGIGQFGLVWVGYLGMAAGMVAAAAGLSKGILSSMLHVHSMHEYGFDSTWPHSIDDITLATVLGVLSLLLVIPAAFFYILIMLVREAALIILVATAPISAGGLVSDVGKVWFWKTLRWFFSCLLISPCAALLLGIGVKLSDGAINYTPPPCAPHHCNDGDWIFSHLKQMNDWQHAQNSASAGMAIVGCIVIAIGAVCPLILFRLLAFVEPGTASGAALRQSWSDAGGMSGLLSGKQSSGSSAATASSGDGRSGGESGAESQTQSRLAAAMGAFGTGTQVATSFAHKAADLGSDVLGGAGVGSPGYSMTPTDERASRNAYRSSSSGGQGGEQSSGQSGGGTPPPSDPPEPPIPPVPSPAPKAPLGPGGGGGGATGAGEGGAAGGAEAAAVAL